MTAEPDHDCHQKHCRTCLEEIIRVNAELDRLRAENAALKAMVDRCQNSGCSADENGKLREALNKWCDAYCDPRKVQHAGWCVHD